MSEKASQWTNDVMETLSTLLVLYERNPLVTDGFPSARPIDAERLYFRWR